MSSMNYLSLHECQNFNMWQPVIFIVQWCPLFQETSSPKILIFFLNTAYEYLHLLVIPDDGVGDII